MNNFKVFLTVSMMALSINKANAADYSYDHNGSKMRVSVEGNDVRIIYQQPKRSLRGLGVRSGTLLFNGRVKDGYLDGKSRIFNRNCGTVDYFVYGDFRPGRTFKLSGAAPVLSNVSCRIVDNSHTSANANLSFVALSGGSSAQPQTGSGCVIGVNSTLNVRVGPGQQYGIIGELPANTCGVKTLSRCKDGWCVIQQRQTIGWVSTRFIQR